MAAGNDVRLTFLSRERLLTPNTYSTSASSLANGGPAGNVWVFLGVCVTMLTVVLSMAEMASM